ncbi:hypothetical protein AAHH79_33620, partial [Burkholderia pseudomallei]
GAIREHGVIDLHTLRGGAGAGPRDGEPHDLRRRNLGTLHYDVGGHGELAVRDAETDAARLAAALAAESARPPSPAAPRSLVQAVRLSPGDRLA